VNKPLRLRGAVLAIGLVLAGCVPPAPQAAAPAPSFTLAPASFADLPGWPNDPLGQIMPALRLQCRRLAMLPADTALGGQGITAIYGGRAGQWSDACAAALALDPDADTHRFFAAWFQPYRVTEAALVTGYFQPVVAGSRHLSAAYQVPVLAKPEDLVRAGGTDASGRPSLGRMANGTVVPYWTRAEIEDGAMGANAHPIAYLASPVDLFFAQIQGSARVQLAEGGTMTLVFGARNGRPYTPIGRVLVDQHALAPDQVSMQSIRAWLDTHPDEARKIMDRNESYVFFREAPDADPSLGPPGALGVDLTPGRSAAVDKAYIPLGAPVFVDSTVPDGRQWRHLVLAQDLGSAISGPARVDVFLGAGEAAVEWAGKMHQSGVIWVLLPRERK
jgi:membrane-bound lytic murein transglycosylase A